MKKMFLGLLVGLLLALIGCTTTEVKHTVSFDTQGGTTIAALEIISGLTLSEPSSPTKEGFEFKGWKVNLEDETFFDFTTPITDDLTLIAVYDALEITITVKDSYGETFDELT